MGQKLDKAPRGAYDAIVYIEGSEVVAEDSTGSEILRGMSGISDAAVTQAAIDFVFANNKGDVYCNAHTYYHSSTVDIKAGVRLIYAHGAIVKPTTDCDIFILRPTSSLSELTIDTSAIPFTHSSVLLDGDGNAYSFLSKDVARLDNIFFKGGHGVGTGNAIYLKSDAVSNGVIDGVVVHNIVIHGYEYGIRMYRSGAPEVNQINGNIFNKIYGNDTVYFIYMAHSGSPVSDLDGNSFSDIIFEVNPSTVTPVTLGGRYNTIDIFVWDNTTPVPILLPAGTSYNTVRSNVAVTNLGEVSNIVEYSTRIPRKITVSGSGADYTTLSAALAAITPTSADRYVIEIFGKIFEASSITLKEYVQIIGYSAIIETTLPGSGYAIVDPGLQYCTVRNVTFRLKASTSTNPVVLHSYGNAGTFFENCSFYNDIIGTTNRAAAVQGNSTYRNCIFVASETCAGGRGVIMNGIGCSPTFTHCIAEGGYLGDGSRAWDIEVNNYPTLIDCVGKVGSSGTGAASYAYYFVGNCAPVLNNCSSELYHEHPFFTYNSANDGRFRPSYNFDYELLSIGVNVIVPRHGITLSVGTVPGGTDVINAVDLGASNFLIVVPKIKISSTAYLYASVSSPVANGDFMLNIRCCRNYANSGAMYIATTGELRILGGSYECPIDNDTVIYIDTTTKNYYIENAFIYSHDITKNAIAAISSISGERIHNCSIFGILTNVVAIDGKSSGSSTGTGSEQTIAHGLAAIPTGCKAWIKYLVGTRYITEMVPFDATNIYPTVETGVAYEWRIE